MARILVVAAVALLAFFGGAWIGRSTALGGADNPEPVPASAEANEQSSAEAPDTTSAETPDTTMSEVYVAPMPPQPVGEMAALDRSIKESCAARAGVPVPEPEDLIAEGDEGFGADPEYLECLAAEGNAVDEMLEEGRSIEEILEARYGE